MRLTLCLFLFCFFASCLTEDVEKVDLELYRFEDYLFNSNISNILERKEIWTQELGTFSSYFDYYIMYRSSKNDTLYCNELLEFVNNIEMKEVYDTIHLRFQDFGLIKKELDIAFEKWRYFFREKSPKKIITLFSGFNYGVISHDSMLIIGLDFFLGPSSKFYTYLDDPAYIKFQKQTRFILPYSIESWINYSFNEYNIGTDFLSRMIYKGKIVYLLSKMLPNYSLENILRFSKDETLWCENNESAIWAYFIENNLLFSKQEREFLSYLNPSPFAKGMPRESPGRLGCFIGYRIIDNYMKKNPELDFTELIKETDSHEILSESKYKPKK